MNTIPAEYAQIEWSEHVDPTGERVVRTVDEVIIFDRRIRQSEAEIARRHKRYDNSHGACIGDWMKGDPRFTPEAVFLEMLRHGGFRDEVAMLNALEQFAQIEEAAWAQTMAKALRLRLIAEEIIPPDDGDVA